MSNAGLQSARVLFGTCTLRTSVRLRAPGPVRPLRAFTLIELLAVIAIIGVLIAILMPALNASRETANDLKCRANYRSVLIQFTNFADDSGAGRRGNSDSIAPRFMLEDFQESVYGIAEFWNVEGERRQLSMVDQPLMCSAGPQFLERRASIPCSAGAVGPAANVSTGFNARLNRETRILSDGSMGPRPAYLTSAILNYPDTPLLFDVDGQVAADRGLKPYYSAPAMLPKDGQDIYSGGEFWFPSMRHRGRMNVGFVGGHVLSSANPLKEPYWKWNFQLNPQ